MPLQHLRAAFVSPDGRYLLAGRRFDDGEQRAPFAYVVDLDSGVLVRAIHLGGDGTDMSGGELRAAAWNGAGDRLATVTDYFGSKVRLWEVPGFRQLGVDAMNEFVTEVAFVGKRLVAISASGGSNALDAATGVEHATVPPEIGSPARVRTLVSTDGPAGLVLLDGDALYRLHPLTLAKGATLLSPPGPLERWAVSDDGRRAVVVGMTVFQMDLVSGRTVASKETPEPYSGSRPEFRPKSASFALSGRGFVGLHRFRAVDPYVRVRLDGADASVVPVMGFSRDGATLYVASGERVGSVAIEGKTEDVTVPVGFEVPGGSVTAIRQAREGAWIEVAVDESEGKRSVRLLRPGDPRVVEALLDGVEALVDPRGRFAIAIAGAGSDLELVRLSDRARIRLAIAGTTPPFTLIASSETEGSIADAHACLHGAPGSVRPGLLPSFVAGVSTFRP